ncbi:MAG: DUF4349 domain-containing protein [Planctomycetota bacterium]
MSRKDPFPRRKRSERRKSEEDSKPGVAFTLEEKQAAERNRKIIKTGDMDFEVDSFETAYKRVAEVAAQEKGFISSSSRQKLANGKVMGRIIIRVPAANFNALMLKLAALGDLKNQSVSAQDVTKQFVDLEARLKGEIKDLLQVEVELGKVREYIESVQGELNYYKNQISLSTLTLDLRERDIEKPFEYVQTLSAQMGVTVEDADAAYEKAHEIVREAKGQILDARMERKEKEDVATGYIQAAVDADVFPAVQEKLKALGHVTQDTITRQQRPSGRGKVKPGAEAPVRKDRAIINLTLSTPPMLQTVGAALEIEAADAATAYETARKAVEAAGGEILGGGVTRHVDGATGTLRARIDAAKFLAIVEKLKGLGEVKQATVEQREYEKKPEMCRETGYVAMAIRTPPRIIESDEGIGAFFHNAISGGIKGLLWSLGMLVVGVAYVGPWLIVVLVIWFLVRRRRKAAATSAE